MGSGIFKSGDPARRAEAIVKATTNFNDPEIVEAAELAAVGVAAHGDGQGAEMVGQKDAEGATMIRTKGEPGTGDVVQAVRHMRRMNAEIRRIQNRPLAGRGRRWLGTWVLLPPLFHDDLDLLLVNAHHGFAEAATSCRPCATCAG